MGIRFYPPCEELRGIVARIYAHESGPSTPGDPRWLIVPDGDVKLILPFAGAIRCQIGDTERLHPASRLILSGMRTKPGGLSFPNGVDAIGVIIRPEAAYRLVSPPHSGITNSTFDGEEIFDARARRLQNELMELPGEEARVARLQIRLCEWLRRHDRRDLAFEHAVCRLKQREGRIRIEQLACEVGWSRRHLERRFLEHIGVGPKDLAKRTAIPRGVQADASMRRRSLCSIGPGPLLRPVPLLEGVQAICGSHTPSVFGRSQLRVVYIPD